MKAPEYIREHALAPAGLEDKSYPMKSYYDYGINLTSHSDFPALSGCPWWPEELLRWTRMCFPAP